jgi:Ca-activated chloride channel family protein
VVGPRYIPGSPVTSADGGGGWSPDTDRVPDASHVTPRVRPPSEGLHDPVREDREAAAGPARGARGGNPVTIDVELDAGFPVGELLSRYHSVLTEAVGGAGRRYRVRLREAQVPADRDFELAWTPRAGRLPQSAAFEEEKDGVRYALVTLFPPVGPAAAQSRLPRETVYLIDTSGSMHGLSIEQARRALLLALERLRPGDRFDVIQFNSTTEALFGTARPVGPATLARARAFVSRLRADGGTELRPALEAALSASEEHGLLRQVVFLTDGSVGNEQELFGVIRARLGETRLFTVGIDSAPNGHFMTKAAELGRGTFTHIGDVSEVQEKMAGLFARLDSPVLTDIQLAWPDGSSVEAWPRSAPDLYLGEPVVVSARLEGSVSSVVVSGRRGGEEWREELALDDSRRGEGMGVLWARRKIEALADSLLEGAPPDEVRSGITALGLAHHLVTKHTSLVAVDVTPVRPEDAALESQHVATNLPHGWSYEAVFGALPTTATRMPFDAAVAALALLFAAALWLADPRARAGGRS